MLQLLGKDYILLKILNALTNAPGFGKSRIDEVME
jgi:hypothetical protein